jgi:GT2 family glycosyltransferase
LTVSVAGQPHSAQESSGSALSTEQAHGPHSAWLGQLDPRVDASIVIVNWKTQELLHACLASILQNTGSTHVEIIVVDNGSRDGSAEMVEREFPAVRLLVNTCNLGFAAANNRGLSAARGRYLLLLNSDTLALPGAIDEMVRYMDTHPCVGAVGPRLLHGDGSLQVSVRDFPRLDHDAAMMLEVKHWPVVGDMARRHLQRAYLPDPEQTREVDWVMGACLLLRREAVEHVGPLDDAYFFFFEDVDLCYRLRQHGWSVVFLGKAGIVHLGGQSWARVSAPRLIWYYRGLLRFYRLHYPRGRHLALHGGVVLGAAGHVLWLLLRRRGAPDERSLLAAYARILALALGGVRQ